MTELLPILKYLHINYSDACCECSVSMSRLVKMLYLADWKSAIDHGEPLTSVQWWIDDCGPNTNEVLNCLKDNPEHFLLDFSLDEHGNIKVSVALCNTEDSIDTLSEDCRNTLDFVLSTMSRLSWTEVTRLVISTYPMITQATGSDLDLAALAKEHRESSDS